MKLSSKIIVIFNSVCLIFLSFSCKPNTEGISNYPDKTLYASRNWKAKINFSSLDKCSIMRLENGDLQTILINNNGLWKTVSKDNGISWTQPELFFNTNQEVFPIIIAAHLMGAVCMDKNSRGGQIFYYPFENDKWISPGIIRDTRWGKFNIPRFAKGINGILYCTWTDWRNGNSDVYFSFSHDYGKTWSDNIMVNEDASGQEQNVAGIFLSSGNILYIMWEDNRNPKTLFDIYCASSKDGGRSWDTGVKVNDDTTYTWQISPSFTINAEGNICAAWMDSRDKSKSGVHSSNIYFSCSSDFGKTWNHNIRISIANKGNNLYPRLMQADDGNLFCWWLSTEDNLLEDILFSYSGTGGRTWNKPVRINDDLERVHHYSGGLISSSTEKNDLVFWNLDWRNKRTEIYFSKILSYPDTARKERIKLKDSDNKIIGPSLNPEKGAVLYKDSFSESNIKHWDIYSGTWIIKNKMLVGYGNPESRVFTGGRFWKDYTFEGRFKLDSIDHRAAYLYLRVDDGDKNNLTYYRITNFFRQGATLEYFDGNVLIPVSSTSFSFHANEWYQFKTVIINNVLNHLINDSLLISTDKIRKNPSGKIGVGSFSSPVYFKNICVTSIK